MNDLERRQAERQYLETALWSSSDSEGGDSLDSEGYDVGDFAEGEAEKAFVELWGFFAEVRELYFGDGVDGDLCQLAHDFWLTRNGHGAGFWDRPHLWGGRETADKFTAACRPYGAKDVYKGDNGKLYFS